MTIALSEHTYFDTKFKTLPERSKFKLDEGGRRVKVTRGYMIVILSLETILRPAEIPQ
jgi:hypothetical protein